MFPRATSIRGKIATGYVLSFLFHLLVASVLFASLHVAEDEVEFSRNRSLTAPCDKAFDDYLVYT